MRVLCGLVRWLRPGAMVLRCGVWAVFALLFAVSSIEVEMGLCVCGSGGGSSRARYYLQVRRAKSGSPGTYISQIRYAFSALFHRAPRQLATAAANCCAAALCTSISACLRELLRPPLGLYSPSLPFFAMMTSDPCGAYRYEIPASRFFFQLGVPKARPPILRRNYPQVGDFVFLLLA